MTQQLFFDSLVHTSRSGQWLDRDHFDASLERLLDEAAAMQPYKACLVNIAGYGDNDELAEIAAAHRDLFVPIAGFDPARHADPDRVGPAVGELADAGFAGIKLHPRLNGYDPLDERCLAAVKSAGKAGLVVFIDTLFRQRGRAVEDPATIIDRIAFACEDTRIVLLHGAAGAMLDIYEIVRMRSNLLLDTSFTLLRYAGSSLDADMRFVFRTLDQRAVVGSDFPEYSLAEARDRVETLLDGLPAEKVRNILSGNLERFFSGWLARSA